MHRVGHTVIAALLCATMVVAASSSTAHAEEAQVETSSSFGVHDVLHRVESLHPQLRARAAVRLRTEIGVRRAKWDRVQAASGVAAGHAVGGSGLAATDPALRPPGSPWSDGFAGQVFADLRLPLWAGGAISNGIEAAEARNDAAREDESFSREDLKRTALVAYASASAARASMLVARAAHERALALVKVAETRRDTGVGTEADVARSRLNALRRQEELTTLEGDVDVALATLRAALVLPEGAPIALRDSLDTLGTYEGTSSGRYPEVLADTARVSAAEADARVARAGYLPRIDLFASGAYQTGLVGGTAGGLGLAPVVSPLSERFQGFQGEATAGVMLTWRGFDMFVVRDRVAQADATADIARATLAETQRAVGGRRAEARARETRARQRVAVLASGDTVANDSVRLARGRYDSGTAILTEVLDTELDRIAVQARQVDAAYELAVAHIERLRAEGSFL